MVFIVKYSKCCFVVKAILFVWNHLVSCSKYYSQALNLGDSPHTRCVIINVHLAHSTIDMWVLLHRYLQSIPANVRWTMVPVYLLKMGYSYLSIQNQLHKSKVDMFRIFTQQWPSDCSNINSMASWQASAVYVSPVSSFEGRWNYLAIRFTWASVLSFTLGNLASL